MSERPFRQVCDSCLRMRTTLPSLATRGGWRPFADWWMCPTCQQKASAEEKQP